MTSSVKLYEQEDVGGWLEGAEGAFDNESDAYEIKDFSDLALDVGREQYFHNYLTRYFNESFIEGQGTEHILQMAKAGHRPGNWLDVGAGTSSLFWSNALRNVTSVTCVDIVPEALKVLEDFRVRHELPKCYVEASKILGNSAGGLAARNLVWRYLVFDVHRAWPGRLLQAYRNITAFGCFGVARNPQAYVAAMRCARPFVAPDGVVIGCDWARSARFVESEGLDNRYMTADFVRDIAGVAGFDVATVEQFGIRGDPLYDRVVGYVLKPVGK